MSETRRISEIGTAIEDFAAECKGWPFYSGLMIEMPCCGSGVEASGLDIAHDDGPSLVHWPMRWTCPYCNQTWTPNPSVPGHLDEVEL